MPLTPEDSPEYAICRFTIMNKNSRPHATISPPDHFISEVNTILCSWTLSICHDKLSIFPTNRSKPKTPREDKHTRNQLTSASCHSNFTVCILIPQHKEVKMCMCVQVCESTFFPAGIHPIRPQQLLS